MTEDEEGRRADVRFRKIEILQKRTKDLTKVTEGKENAFLSYEDDVKNENKNTHARALESLDLSWSAVNSQGKFAPVFSQVHPGTTLA